MIWVIARLDCMPWTVPSEGVVTHLISASDIESILRVNPLRKASKTLTSASQWHLFRHHRGTWKSRTLRFVLENYARILTHVTQTPKLNMNVRRSSKPLESSATEAPEVFQVDAASFSGGFDRIDIVFFAFCAVNRTDFVRNDWYLR